MGNGDLSLLSHIWVTAGSCLMEAGLHGGSSALTHVPPIPPQWPEFSIANSWWPQQRCTGTTLTSQAHFMTLLPCYDLDLKCPSKISCIESIDPQPSQVQRWDFQEMNGSGECWTHQCINAFDVLIMWMDYGVVIRHGEACLEEVDNGDMASGTISIFLTAPLLSFPAAFLSAFFYKALLPWCFWCFQILWNHEPN